MSYGPPLWRPVALLAAALLTAAAGFTVHEFWALDVVLLAAVARDLWCRPALTFDDEGFHYVVGLRRQFTVWASVDTVRVRQERHFFAFGRTLEIDLDDDTLIVLSKAQLGAEPDEVATALEAAWRAAIN